MFKDNPPGEDWDGLDDDFKNDECGSSILSCKWTVKYMISARGNILWIDDEIEHFETPHPLFRREGL